MCAAPSTAIYAVARVITRLSNRSLREQKNIVKRTQDSRNERKKLKGENDNSAKNRIYRRRESAAAMRGSARMAGSRRVDGGAQTRERRRLESRDRHYG